MHEKKFAPGFRLSAFDAVILAVGALAALAAATIHGGLAFVVAFVVGHFFLFCNIVRLARPLELAWAALFIVLAAFTVVADRPGWSVMAGVSLVATVVVVAVEMRKPSYHGVGWQWINPGLPAWWEARQRATSESVE